MMRKKTLNDGPQSAELDPTLPFTEVEVGGRKLKMCLNFRALAAAEAAMDSQGLKVDLLDMLPHLGKLSVVLPLFACSLQHFQPEIGVKEAMDLPRNATELSNIRLELYKLWDDSTPDLEKGSKPADPLPPEA